MKADQIQSSQARARRLWKFLRVVFLMMRKGITAKSRFVIDLNLAMKRGKINGRSLRGLLHFHHHRPSVRGYAPREYEFSCTNTPDPVFFHARKRRKLRYLPNIPCINVKDYEDSDPSAFLAVPRIEFSPEKSPHEYDSTDFGEGGRISPALSPLPIAISSYYPSDEDEESNGGNWVDEKAEEFIASFYEQLRSQGRMALLQYQDMEVQEMLARGC